MISKKEKEKEKVNTKARTIKEVARLPMMVQEVPNPKVVRRGDILDKDSSRNLNMQMPRRPRVTQIGIKMPLRRNYKNIASNGQVIM